jgi:hypothetical protein
MYNQVGAKHYNNNVHHVVWGIVAVTFILSLFCTASCIYFYTQLVPNLSDRVDKLEDKTSGLSNSPVIAGTHLSDKDVGVKETLFVGKNALINETLYVHDIEILHGGTATINGSIAVTTGNISAPNGIVSAQCAQELRTITLDPDSSVEITDGSVISKLGPYATLGWADYGYTTVADSLDNIANMNTFNLSSTRQGNLYLDSSDILRLEIIDFNPHTLARSVYTTRPSLFSAGVAYAGGVNPVFYGIGTTSDTSFVVFYNEPLTGTTMKMAGVDITLSYPTITSTTVSTAQTVGAVSAPACVQDFDRAYVDTNTVVTTYSDVNGLAVQLWDITLSTWTFTSGTARIVDATLEEECGVGRTAVTYRNGYVCVAYGGGASDAAVHTKCYTASGTTLTALATDLTVYTQVSTAGLTRFDIFPLSSTYYGIMIDNAANEVFGYVYTFLLNTATGVVGFVKSDETASLDIHGSSYGYLVDFVAGSTAVVPINGDGDTEQNFAACQSSTTLNRYRIVCNRFTFSEGLFVEDIYSSSMPVTISSGYQSAYSMNNINGTVFAVLYGIEIPMSDKVLQFAAVSTDSDYQLYVDREKGKVPIGQAMGDAAPGESFQVLIKGCRTDPDLFPYTEPTWLCMHGDGQLLPSNYNSAEIAGSKAQPICPCYAWGDGSGTIYCDYAFSTRSPML